jgi:hypothetical protein
MSSEAPTIDRKPALRQPMRLLANILSLRYFLLRASTAAAALAFGLIQTFVFARVLSLEDFSIYILIGTFGVSLWLFDLGAAKILFVRQLERRRAALWPDRLGRYGALFHGHGEPAVSDAMAGRGICPVL